MTDKSQEVFHRNTRNTSLGRVELTGMRLIFISMMANHDHDNEG